MSATRAKHNPTSTLATLLGVGSIFLWCWTGVCYRAGAIAMGPMAYLALIAATGAATVVLLRLVQRKPIAWLIRLPGRVVIAGFFGVAVYSILLAEAFGVAEERDFGQVNLLNYLWPLWVVVLGVRLLPDKTRLTPPLAGAALGFAGFLIAGGPGSLTHPPTSILPHVMALSGGFLWALYSVLLRRWKEPAERSGVPLYFAICALLAAAVAAIRGEWVSVNWANGSTAFWILLGGIGPTGLAYYWWEIAMKRGDARLVVSLGFTIPIVSSILIGLFFGKAMNAGLLPGAAMIALGAYLAWSARRVIMPKIDRQARILILGAGPGGLAAAHYLRRYGYKNVTVLEKLGRVGGLCCSVTEDNQAFDLGALVISPAYREIRRMAHRVGARLQKVYGAAAFRLDDTGDGKPYHPLLDYLTGGSSFTAFLRYLLLSLRYLWIRFRLRKLFRQPGWTGISTRDELCVPFSQWLRDHRLEELARSFEIPITAFGYGNLDEIPAPYALRYMDSAMVVATFLSSLRFAWLIPAPLLLRRFRHGFQRFWERIAWDLNVRLNVQVKSIDRADDGVTVTYTHPVQILNQQVTHAEDRAEFDYLIIACPLVKKDLEQIMQLTDEEAKLQSRIQFVTYAVASFEVSGLVLRERAAFHLPLPPIGEPMVAYQGHPDNELTTFYARLPTSEPTADDERQLREHIERYVRALGGQINDEDDWHSYDAWLYFKHVAAEDFRDGYYDRWAHIQGANRTFYVGGLFDFDYVEGVARYSRAVIEEHFVGRN